MDFSQRSGVQPTGKLVPLGIIQAQFRASLKLFDHPNNVFLSGLRGVLNLDPIISRCPFTSKQSAIWKIGLASYYTYMLYCIPSAAIHLRIHLPNFLAHNGFSHCLFAMLDWVWDFCSKLRDNLLCLIHRDARSYIKSTSLFVFVYSCSLMRFDSTMDNVVMQTFTGILLILVS